MGKLSFLTERPVAHRGLHDVTAGIIENTASAVGAAVAAGYGIEVDIQLSADGEAMVFHDFALDRLTFGHGPISSSSAEALEQIAFKGTTDRMMRLGDLLEQVRGRVPLFIEIKSAFTGDRRLARRAAQLVAAYEGPAALMSFDPALVAEVAETAPAVPRGIVAERHYDHPEWAGLPSRMRFTLAHLLHWPRSRFQFMAYRVADLEAFAPRMARVLGVPLLTWTVRTAEDQERAQRLANQMIFEGFRPPLPS